MPTIIEAEILEDGTLSIKTGDIDEEKHISADDLLNELEKELGGKRETTKRKHPFLKNKRVLRGGRIVSR